MKRVSALFLLLIAAMITNAQEIRSEKIPGYNETLAKIHKLPDSSMLDLARKMVKVYSRDSTVFIVQKYINDLTDEQLLSKPNIWLMYEFSNNTGNRSFAFFRDNAEKIAEVEPMFKPEFSKYFTYTLIYLTEMAPYARSLNGKTDWKKIKRNIKKYGTLGKDAYEATKTGMIFDIEIAPELKKDATWTRIFPIIKKQKAGKGEEFLVGSTIVYYLNAIDAGNENIFSDFMAAANIYAKQYPGYLTASSKNDWAWSVFQNSNNKDHLDTALVWSESAVKEMPGNANVLDTYANLLYKMGKADTAISLQEKAVNLDPGNVDLKKNLAKMKDGVPTWTK